LKKIFYIFIFSISFSCNNRTQSESSSKIIIDPNPTSEMAQLMRDMTLKLEGIKTAIENNKVLNENQLDFALIHNQKATDSSFVKPHIKPMSESFAYAIEQFNNEPNPNNYSTIINNCLSCHQLSCPGPVVRINQLKLNH
jgi:hypothetical protein